MTLADLVDDTGNGLRTDAISRYVNMADCLHKQLIVAIAPIVPNYHGLYESFPPAWDGVVPYVTYEVLNNGEDIRSTRVPIPWDPTYLARYASIVTQLGAAIDGDPRIARVLVGYGTWGELHFDLRAHREDGAGDLSLAQVRALWQGLGFTDQAWLAAASEVSGMYGAAFSITPLAAQLTDVGARLLYDDATFDAQQAQGFPGLGTLLESFAADAVAHGVDELQYDGLSAMTRYGTEKPVYDAIESQPSAARHFEAFLYSGLDRVTGCDPSMAFPRDGCADAAMLSCALFRADKFGATAVTLWANEWTQPDTLAVIQNWRSGAVTTCEYCSTAASLTGRRLAVASRFCPPAPVSEWRGQEVPNITWNAGLPATENQGWYYLDLPLLAVGIKPILNLTNCATTHGWANFNQWADLCEGSLGPYVRCKTDGTCNLYMYVDSDLALRSCPSPECDIAIAYPSVARVSGAPNGVALSSSYLPAATCIEVMGELPNMTWDTTAVRSTTRDSEGYFLTALPSTDGAAKRFSYRDCDDSTSWARYSQACEAGAGGGFCYDDGPSDSLRVIVDAAGAVTPSGNQ
jgi:hypothetical protein